LRPSYDFNNTITVLVSKTEQEFTVHKDPICAKSKFFNAACSERWNGLRSSDGKQRAIRLPETSVRDSQAYVHWIYTSQIEVEGDDADKKHDDHIDMYILGDLLDDYQLRNAALEKLIMNLPFAMYHPGIVVITHVYECTPVGSPLRKLLVDRKICRGDRDDFAADLHKYPVEFTQEVALALMSQTAFTSRLSLIRRLKEGIRTETGDA